MRFVIVTGMSGAGKQSAMKMLEDMGYFCIDNLPVFLLEKFAELFAGRDDEFLRQLLCSRTCKDSCGKTGQEIKG